MRPFNAEKSNTLMNLGNYPRFSNASERQWPPKDKPQEQSAGVQTDEPSQMEFPFMNDLLQAQQNKPLEFTNNVSRFNVPPKTAVANYPALPPNPMRNRL